MASPIETMEVGQRDESVSLNYNENDLPFFFVVKWCRMPMLHCRTRLKQMLDK